jgi:HSP20 family protein
MSIRIWNPFVELARLENNIKDAFEPFSGNFFAPLTDLSENNEGFELTMNVPGIKASDLHIDATADFIEIKAETIKNKESNEDEKAEDSEYTPRHIERTTRNYYRKIHFSAPVDPTKAKTNLKDGVLTINIPKRPEAKKIQIKIE